MFNFPENKQSIAQIWSSGWKLYLKNIKDVWWLAILLIVPSLIHIYFSTQYKTGLEHVAGFGKGATLTEDYNLIYNYYAQNTMAQVDLVLGFVLGFLTLYFSAVLMHKMYYQVKDFKFSFVAAGKKYFKILIASIIYYIMLVIGGLLVLPGIFLAFLFAFYLPAILFDDSGIIGSIVESARIVWGNWWRTTLVILLPVLLSFILIQMIASMFMAYISLYLITIMILNVFFIPYLMSVILVQFYDLKVRRALKYSAPA
jgi:hypothetical protein